MSGARWRILVRELADAGVDVTLDEYAYSEDRYGRVHHGVTRSITLRLADGGLLGVHDKWARFNADIWLGWQVHTENADGITTRSWPFTKDRRDVIAAAVEAKVAQVA